MKKGFVISWFYPPGNSSEGLVTYKLLSNSKLHYDVWTRNDQHQNMWDRKSDEKELVSKNVNIVLGPGDIKEWVEAGVKYFIEHKDEYSFIMSRSMPPESHEIGLKIKEKVPEIKWIASFGDPLVDTPYVNEITMEGLDNPFSIKECFTREKFSIPGAMKLAISPLRLANKTLWKKEAKKAGVIGKYYNYINDSVLKLADRIIYNNDYQLEHAFKQDEYKEFRRKACVIEHSFDESLYPLKKETTKKLSFVYVGHLDDNRNAMPLFKAIRVLKDNDPKLGEKVSFDFYGHLCADDKLYILEKNIYDIVKIHGDVSYIESLRLIKNADWAILIDANFTAMMDECIFLPAKTMDYLGARTKIFLISHIKGADSDILRKTGGGIIVTHVPDEICMYLSKIIYQGYKPEEFNKKEVDKYSSINVAKRMDGEIERVIKLK